ncbi:hypothetical protein [Yoonia sp. MH D7]
MRGAVADRRNPKVSKDCIITERRVFYVSRPTISVLMVLKNVRRIRKQSVCILSAVNTENKICDELILSAILSIVFLCKNSIGVKLANAEYVCVNCSPLANQHQFPEPI